MLPHNIRYQQEKRKRNPFQSEALYSTTRNKEILRTGCKRPTTPTRTALRSWLTAWPRPAMERTKERNRRSLSFQPTIRQHCEDTVRRSPTSRWTCSTGTLRLGLQQETDGKEVPPAVVNFNRNTRRPELAEPDVANGRRMEHHERTGCHHCNVLQGAVPYRQHGPMIVEKRACDHIELRGTNRKTQHASGRPFVA